MPEDFDALTPTQLEIAATCDALKELLIRKNRAYGDSALSPIRIFSRASALEQIRVRMDDKLSRLSRGHALSDESLDDTVWDFLGYGILYLVAKAREEEA